MMATTEPATEQPCNMTRQTKAALKYHLKHTKQQEAHYTCIYTLYFLTVFADVKLPEIDEVCNRRWQHCQVIIWHAQSVEYLAVK